MDLTPGLRLQDFVSVTRHYDKEANKLVRTPQFAPVRMDPWYGMYIGLTLGDKEIDSPVAALLIDLIKWGYENKETPYSVREEALASLPDTRLLPKEVPLLKQSRSLREFLTPASKIPYIGLPIGKRGYKGSAEGITSGDVALLGALEVGRMLSVCDNGVSNIHVDDTDDEFTRLKALVEGPDFPRFSDAKWKTVPVSRCICDFECVVKFTRPPSEQEISTFKSYMFLRSDFPGMFGIRTRDLGEGSLRLTTTMDTTG